MFYFLNFQRDNRLNASAMDSANGKNGEKDCILHHTVEMKQSHPMTEPTRKGREHFSAFSLFITKCLKGITGLGCVFSVLQHTENELQRKNGEQANGNQTALLGGRAVRAFLHRCDELFEAQDDGGVDDSRGIDGNRIQVPNKNQC